ncbi:hypothetical protein VKT23_014407 [Stygiomarasmius scandens]|uniref:Uncharacterized protein n=1 Tax=Marasmiellus scandens TaxID=2682957 RepID=A0ABR1J343_9AGAR
MTNGGQGVYLGTYNLAFLFHSFVMLLSAFVLEANERICSTLSHSRPRTRKYNIHAFFSRPPQVALTSPESEPEQQERTDVTNSNTDMKKVYNADGDVGSRRIAWAGRQWRGGWTWNQDQQRRAALSGIYSSRYIHPSNEFSKVPAPSEQSTRVRWSGFKRL